ncbi:amidohydrolase family protein [Streptomyces collinus]|uniref:amidohydrolase family protein n=1 Tax=Streptomyces collinus TaxID=42684 RepID=UPI0036ECC390
MPRSTSAVRARTAASVGRGPPSRRDQLSVWSARVNSQQWVGCMDAATPSKGRAGRAFRCRDLWAAGARVVLGSDWPIAPYPPLQVMAGARHRRPAGLSLPPHGPGQALTPLQALQGITLNAAWVAGEEQLAGRLAVGHRADLTVLAGDPLDVPDDELAGLPVVLTVVAGRPTHRAAGL